MSTHHPDDFFFPPFVGPSKEERVNYLQNEIQRWRVNPPQPQNQTVAEANGPLTEPVPQPPLPEDVIARLELALQRLIASEG